MYLQALTAPAEENDPALFADLLAVSLSAVETELQNIEADIRW